MMQCYTGLHGLEPSLADLDIVEHIEWTLLPSTMPYRPIHEKLVSQGGSEWPARWRYDVIGWEF
jgi:hypothetical protein